jgi:hypothetical protein
MKRTLLILFAVSSGASANSQSITPSVIAAAGNHAIGSNAQLSWTIGECLTTTVSNGSGTITQGFHQTTLNVVSIEEQNVAGVNVTVFPNPTSDHVSIALKNNVKALQIELLDINGKLLLRQKVEAEVDRVQLSMMEYAHATYLLRIFCSDGSTNNTYRIEKLSH